LGTEKASYDRGGGRPSERQARQGEQEATDPMGGPFHYARRPTRAEMVSGIGNPEQKMKMQKLAEFVALHRERFDTEHNNIFAFSFSKILRRFAFLQIIHDRHLAASMAFVANSEAMLATTLPASNTRPITPEQVRLYQEGGKLGTEVQLEIESFYLFAKILLDDIARALEYYFGPVRSAPLDSHDDFAKHLHSFAKAKTLIIPHGFEEAVLDLRRRISDVRDQQIAHEKSPRTMVAMTWLPGGRVRTMATKLYPKESDQHSETETLDSLCTALEAYGERMIGFIKLNQDRTRLKVAPPKA